MKKTLLTCGEYALVALVTAILGVMFFLAYPIDVGIKTVKWIGRFFSS